jgi:spore coat polysaccharide biosynthesis protein SpsF
MDVEVMTMEALQTAHREATEPYQREHVTPYLYEVTGLYQKISIDAPGDYGSYRWAVDTAEDLEFVRQVYKRFPGDENFGFEDVLSLLEREPELLLINVGIDQKSMHDVG